MVLQHCFWDGGLMNMEHIKKSGYRPLGRYLYSFHAWWMSYKLKTLFLGGLVSWMSDSARQINMHTFYGCAGKASNSKQVLSQALVF